MNIAEMHLSFDIVADYVATTGYPGIEPEEKDFFLNRAIERFVKTRYTGNNIKGQGFDQSIKRIEDLRTLLRRNTTTHTLVIQSPINKYEWSYTLPITGSTDPKYLFLVSASVSIDRDECGTLIPQRSAADARKIRVREITLDEKEAFLDDPFHEPDYNEALMLIEDTKVYIYTNGLYNIMQFNMIYLTYPDKVSLITPVNCNLPEQTHQEIVDNAVRLFIVGLGDASRAQIESQVIKEQE